MSKAALGRGLGELMRAADTPLPAALVKGTGEQPKGTLEAESPSSGRCGEAQRGPAKRGGVPAWFFFGADLVLLFFTSVVVLTLPKPLGAMEVLFCTVGVGIAGAMGVIGLLRSGQ
jgi:hypothetical protein